ncbi:uncharacterized protein LOC105662161 isoform X1 [Megachile rotundata]|uniref:uncharacterized protein LOC105662161 isoform X1 n=1 Tax=Megachile rotundata TaxID=143995 RepID=UPI003FD16A6F
MLVILVTLAAVFFLTLFVSAIALPVKPDSKLGPLTILPFVVEDSPNNESRVGSSPMLYALILSKLDEADNTAKLIEKRETKEDDLETAAGNFAFRPLFVYRQQLAYKQRARNVYSRRNGF